MLSRVLVELQEHVSVIDDLGERFGELGAEVDFEGLDRDSGVVEVLTSACNAADNIWRAPSRTIPSSNDRPAPPLSLADSAS